MERIGREVERELARGGSKDAIPLAALTAAWPDAVGEAIARHAWPLRISRDGTLHVATSSSAWANELVFFADEIVTRLAERLGPEAPKALRCAAGPIPESARSTEPEAVLEPAVEVPAEIAAEADSAAAAIDDPELRELVARAARTSLARARSGRQF
jgi:hypothetical protein